MWARFLILALASALLIVTSAEPGLSGSKTGLKPVLDKTLSTETVRDVGENGTNDDDDDGVYDPDTVVEGIRLGDLSPKELYLLLDDVDNAIVSELDILVLKKQLEERAASAATSRSAEDSEATSRQAERPSAHQDDEAGSTRKKRWGRLASAVRGIFRGSRRAPRPTRSGTRVTREYNRRGNYQDAQRHFDRLNPRDQSSFQGQISGRSGRLGNHRVTVRDGSSGANSRPTLEIRTPRPDGTTYVRKFRYNDPQ